MLGSADLGDDVVIADLEAGLGTLTRLRETDTIDVLLLVVEPTAKAIEVASRAAAVASDKRVGRVVVVANRSRGEGDIARVREILDVAEIVAVPDDPAVAEADRRGVAPFDAAPDSPAVTALRGLAEHLL